MLGGLAVTAKKSALSEFIAKRRAEMRWSREDVAERARKCGHLISASYVAMLEKGDPKTGRASIPTIGKLDALAACLMLDRSELLRVIAVDQGGKEAGGARIEIDEEWAPVVRQVVPMPVVLPDNLLKVWGLMTPTERGDILRLLIQRVAITWERAAVHTRELPVPRWPATIRLSIPRLNRPRQVGRRT